MLRLWITAVSFAVISVLPLVAQQSPRLETRAFDIGGLTEPFAMESLGHWRLPLAHALWSDAEGEPDAKTIERFDISISDLIRSNTSEEAWSEPGVKMVGMDDGRVLLITQTPEVLAQIDDLFAELTEDLRQLVDLEVLVVETNQGGAASLFANAGILSSTAFDSLRGGKDLGLRVVGSLFGSAISHQSIVLRDTRSVAFVGDYEVEVAQSAQIADPRSRNLVVGNQVQLRPIIFGDGRVGVRVAAELSGDLKLVPFETKSVSIGKIQLANVAVTKVTGSGVVGSGEAFVVGAVGGDNDPHRLLVIRPTLRTKKAINGFDRLQIIDTQLLGVPRVSPPRIRLGRAVDGEPNQSRNSEGDGDDIFTREPSGGVLDELHDLIRNSVNPNKWETEPFTIHSVWGRLLIGADKETISGVQNFVKTFGSSRAKYACTGVYVVNVSRTALATTRQAAGESWLRQILRAPETVRRFTSIAVAELGSTTDVLCGREASYIEDFNVEIAQAAAIADPQVETCFSGAYIRLLPFAMQSGQRFGLHFSITLSEPKTQEFAALDLESTEIGRIQQPDMRLYRNSGMVVLDEKEYALLGEYSDTSASDAVTLVIAHLGAVPAVK